MFLQVSVILSTGGVCLVAWGVCVFLFVGGCGFIRGAMHGFIWGGGHVWFYLGGHAWFSSGGPVWFYSGGPVWFYSGGMCGFIQGACMVLFRGGVHGFSVFQFFRIQWDTVNERAVRILLECILVFEQECLSELCRTFLWMTLMALSTTCHSQIT